MAQKKSKDDELLELLAELLKTKGPSSALQFITGLDEEAQNKALLALLNAFYDLSQDARLTVGEYLGLTRFDTALVNIGGTRYLVSVSDELRKEVANLTVGSSVIVGQAGQGKGILAIIDNPPSTKQIATVKEVLGQSVMVEIGSGDVVLDVPPGLGLIREGDRVACVPSLGLVLSVMPRPKLLQWSADGVQPRWFSDFAGIDGVIEYLRQRVIVRLVNNQHFSSYTTSRIRIDIPKGVLLYGPRGNGKTSLATALHFEVAKEMGIPPDDAKQSLMIVAGPAFENMWYGESQRLVGQFYRELRERAKEVGFATAIMDDFDALSRTRGVANDGGRTASESLVTKLLAEMDGLVELRNAMTVATTNRIELVDSAFLRPGRFSERIPMTAPDRLATVKAFRHYLEGARVDGDPDALAAQLADHVFASGWEKTISYAIIEYGVSDALGKAAYRSLKKKGSGSSATAQDILEAAQRQILTAGEERW